ncbi:MAG TPA: hypothetical protein VMZ50_14120, partial [Phycisphaerae bacterium]|nr:hypothetical protein [Phycisphaerae bacterium]
EQWREASGAPRDLPESARATYAKKDLPWHRFYQLRGSTPAIPALMKNALTGDLLGKMQVIPAQRQVKRIIGGTERLITIGSGGGMATMGKAWQDLFVWHFGRQVRLARRHGWWWDETWPTYRSGNLAAGEAYLRNPEDVGDKEIPWQEKFLTFAMRGMFKRLSRVFAESGVPCRNYLWANNSATAFESFAYDTMLVEGASSDHGSFELDNVVVYPNSLFKYNSHNFTGLVTRLVPRDASARNTMSRAGDDKRLDRQLLGRGLLNDIGVRPRGPHGTFQHNEQCVRFLNALIDFGYFEDQGIEMIPYWRNGDVVRYGRKLSAEQAMKDRLNPHVVSPARVYVTAYRHPCQIDGRKGYEVLLLIMNENDTYVRDRLYIPDPGRLFGAANNLTMRAVTGADAPAAGGEGDLPESLSRWSRADVVLRDAEDGGFVQRASHDPSGGEVYDNVFVLPHDYRLLYGRFVPEK